MTTGTPWIRGSALLVVVLAVGIAIGFEFGRARPPAYAMNPPQHAMDSATMMQAFDRALSLDSAQHAGIAAVLGHRQAGIDSAWRALQPHVRAAMDSTQLEILGFLNDAQREKFRALMRGAHGQASAPSPPM